jgi:hypothetical protein
VVVTLHSAPCTHHPNGFLDWTELTIYVDQVQGIQELGLDETADSDSWSALSRDPVRPRSRCMIVLRDSGREIQAH